MYIFSLKYFPLFTKLSTHPHTTPRISQWHYLKKKNHYWSLHASSWTCYCHSNCVFATPPTHNHSRRYCFPTQPSLIGNFLFLSLHLISIVLCIGIVDFVNIMLDLIMLEVSNVGIRFYFLFYKFFVWTKCRKMLSKVLLKIYQILKNILCQNKRNLKLGSTWYNFRFTRTTLTKTL